MAYVNAHILHPIFYVIALTVGQGACCFWHFKAAPCAIWQGQFVACFSLSCNQSDVPFSEGAMYMPCRLIFQHRFSHSQCHITLRSTQVYVFSNVLHLCTALMLVAVLAGMGVAAGSHGCSLWQWSLPAANAQRLECGWPRAHRAPQQTRAMLCYLPYVHSGM